MRRLTTALLVVGLAATTFGAVESGKPAPDFTGTDIQGKTQKLSDYKGKIVVLESINMDCPFVKNHYKSGAMPELQAEMAKEGVIWLVINSTAKGNPSYRTPEQAKTEAAQTRATAWIDDNSGEIGKAYGMRTTPHMFVIDTEGVLVYQGAIDDRPAPRGDPRTAHNYVRDAVRKIKTGGKPEVAETKPYGCGVKYGG